MSKDQVPDKIVELTYHQDGDFLTPDIAPLTPPSQEIGKYGMLRNDYLQENNRVLLTQLIFEDKINEHLVEIDQAAKKRLKLIMEGMLKQNPAPDKGADPMAWVGHMNNIQAQAHEIVMTELIYS